MLYLRNVRKQYHDTVVLAIPELTLKPGIYWIKGRTAPAKPRFL